MTEVKVKTEVPDDYIEEVIWQEDTKDSKKSIKDGPGDVPAEICVVIGGVRNQQTLGEARGTPPSGMWCGDEALESCAWTLSSAAGPRARVNIILEVLAQDY